MISCSNLQIFNCYKLIRPNNLIVVSCCSLLYTLFFSKMIIRRRVLVYWQIEFLCQDIELWMIILVQIWQCPPISNTSLYRMWGGFQAKRQWFVRNPCIDIKIRIVQWNHFSRQVLPTFYQIQLIDKPNMLNGKWKWAYFVNGKKKSWGGGGREGGQLNLKCFLR